MIGILSVSCMSDFDSTYGVPLCASTDVEKLKTLCNKLNKKVQEYISVNGYDIHLNVEVLNKLGLYSEIQKEYPKKYEDIFENLKTLLETDVVCLIGNIFIVECVLEVDESGL